MRGRVYVKRVRGKQGAVEAIFYGKAEGVRLEVRDQIVEGGKVVSRFTAEGTNKGELLGIPAMGKPVQVTGITIGRFENGKLVPLNPSEIGLRQVVKQSVPPFPSNHPP